jgi:hypothetical protein
LLLPVHCTTNTDNFNPQPRADTPCVSVEVLAALPAGSALARSQAAFYRAVVAHPDTAALRAHARENLTRLSWVLSSMACWEDRTVRPTWPVLQARTGLSRRSVARWLAWLRARGLVGIVEAGTTPRFAPMALDAGAGNRASVYVLCVPQTAGAKPGRVQVAQETGTPTLSGLEIENPYPRARANQPSANPPAHPKRRSKEVRRPGWSRTQIARTKADRLELAEALRSCALALRPLSVRALRSVLRPWSSRPELGWTLAWLLHALDHTPDGRPYTYTTPVRAPARWLAHRLSAWTDEHGQPLPSPGVARAAEDRLRRAETARRQDARAEQQAQADAGRAFSQLIRDTAGEHYPALVQAVLARHTTGVARLMPAAAAEALTRQAICDRLPSTPAEDVADPRAVAVAVGELLGETRIEAG